MLVRHAWRVTWWLKSTMGAGSCQPWYHSRISQRQWRGTHKIHSGRPINCFIGYRSSRVWNNPCCTWKQCKKIYI